MTLASLQPDPDALQSAGRAIALLVGLSVFAIVLITGLFVVYVRRRARRRAADDRVRRPADDRDAWAESAKRLETPKAPPETRRANPNEDTSSWDSPHTNGAHDPQPPEPDDDLPDNNGNNNGNKGPFQ
ncbi:MAG: hypothetical protein AAGK04_12070 [Planctomycetota bacterium]